MSPTYSRVAQAINAPVVERFFRAVAYAAIPASLAPGGALTCLYFVAAYGFVAYWRGGASLDPELRNLGTVFAAWYAGLLLIDLVNGGSVVEIVKPAANYFALLAFPFFVLGLRLSRVDHRMLIMVVMAVVGIAVGWSLIQHLLLGVVQARAFKLGSTLFGMIVLTWSLYLFSDAIRRPEVDRLTLAVAFVGLIPIFLSGSKIVWSCTIVGVLLIALMRTDPGRRLQVLLAGAVGVFILGFAISRLAFTEGRIASLLRDLEQFSSGDTTGPSVGLRYEAAVSGLRAFLEHPWLGYGLSNVKAAAVAHRLPSFSDLSSLPHLHNDYIVHLVAFGVLGLVFLVWFFVTMLIHARRRIEPGLRWFGIAMALIFPLFMTVEIVFNQDPAYALLFLVFGFVFLSPPDESTDAPGTQR